jgi:hypothetical protein
MTRSMVRPGGGGGGRGRRGRAEPPADRGERGAPGEDAAGQRVQRAAAVADRDRGHRRGGGAALDDAGAREERAVAIDDRRRAGVDRAHQRHADLDRAVAGQRLVLVRLGVEVEPGVHGEVDEHVGIERGQLAAVAGDDVLEAHHDRQPHRLAVDVDGEDRGLGAAGVAAGAVGHVLGERREVLDQRVVLAADHAVDLVAAAEEAAVGGDQDGAVPLIAIGGGDRADEERARGGAADRQRVVAGDVGGEVARHLERVGDLAPHDQIGAGVLEHARRAAQLLEVAGPLAGAGRDVDPLVGLDHADRDLPRGAAAIDAHAAERERSGEQGDARGRAPAPLAAGERVVDRAGERGHQRGDADRRRGGGEVAQRRDAGLAQGQAERERRRQHDLDDDEAERQAQRHRPRAARVIAAAIAQRAGEARTDEEQRAVVRGEQHQAEPRHRRRQVGVDPQEVDHPVEATDGERERGGAAVEAGAAAGGRAIDGPRGGQGGDPAERPPGDRLGRQHPQEAADQRRAQAPAGAARRAVLPAGGHAPRSGSGTINSSARGTTVNVAGKMPGVSPSTSSSTTWPGSAGVARTTRARRWLIFSSDRCVPAYMRRLFKTKSVIDMSPIATTSNSPSSSSASGATIMPPPK